MEWSGRSVLLLPLSLSLLTALIFLSKNRSHRAVLSSSAPTPRRYHLLPIDNRASDRYGIFCRVPGEQGQLLISSMIFSMPTSTGLLEGSMYGMCGYYLFSCESGG